MIILFNILMLGFIPSLSLAAPSSLFSTSCNESSHFDCLDASTPCIPLEWLCDNVHDCPNGRDELNCRYSYFCPDRVLMCGDDECVHQSFRCDSMQDCSDGADEKGCHEMYEIMDKHRVSTQTLSSSSLFYSSTSRPRVAPPVCSEKEFSCKVGQCIEMDARCDGIEDCPLGDDEIGCGESLAKTMTCNSGFQQCGDEKMCIPTTWACDGEEDCVDGTDEAHCERFSGEIIRRQLENGKDNSTYEYTDWCDKNGQQCSQICINEISRYVCQCVVGYELVNDLHTCYLAGMGFDGVLSLSVAAEIRSHPLFSPSYSSHIYETISTTNGTIKSLALFIKHNKIFAAITQINHEGVMGVVGDGTVKSLRENITGIEYIDADWVGGNILYTVRYPSSSPGIYVCATSGLFCKRIVKGKTNKRQNYRGLAVNPLRGLVAWIDVTEKEQKIMVANMDGSGIRVAVDSKLMKPSALSFDVIKNDLYFSDIDKKVIEKINLDSGYRKTVTYPVHHAHEIAFFNSYLYWTEWGTKSLKVAAVGNLYSLPHLIHGFIQLPNGLSINHTLSQPSLSNNPCESVSCPWICVVVQGDDDSKKEMEARCMCPDEYEKNKEYDTSINGSLPCKLRKYLEDDERALMSHVSVEAMEDYCRTGSVCMNGGSCVEHANVHGIVHKITCKCASGYSGLWCEVMALPDSVALNEDEI